MTASADGTKKRKPPTFRHLPVDRAKKLKRSWVEVQKIKSQWKAQKRKEGLLTKEKQLEELVADANDVKARPSNQESGVQTQDEEDDASVSEKADTSSEGEEEDSGSEETRGGPSSPRARPPPAKRQKKTRREVPTEEDKPTLRELQKQAYSRSSLHTHKSDPLHRRRDSQSNRGVSSSGPGRGQERGRGRGKGAPQRGRGRGQPDMRLRMNAMLEKIKRDFV